MAKQGEPSTTEFNWEKIDGHSTGWLILALVTCVLFCLPALRQSFGSPLTIQDDARDHVVWALRYGDPGLFPNDFIADYYQSVSPLGFRWLYFLSAKSGIDALTLSRWLPLPLALITTGFCFFFGARLTGSYFFGWLATLFLNLNLWMKDDLVTGTPRAFVYPLIAAALFFAQRNMCRALTLTVVLQSLLYPPLVPLLIVVQALSTLELDSLFRSKPNHRGLKWLFISLLLALPLTVLFTRLPSEYGPVVTQTAAKLMPEFGEIGRTRFFIRDSWAFWLWEERSGFFPREWWSAALPPPQAFLLLAFPLAMAFSDQGGVGIKERVQWKPVWALVAASTGMFWFAHLVLFKLYLPSRYSQHTLRFFAAFTGSYVLAVIHQKLKNRIGEKFLCLFSAILVLFFPFLLNSRAPHTFPEARIVSGGEPLLYEFFQKQPKDIRIASLDEEANNLPAFAKRSILCGRETAAPYHSGFYSEIRRRARGLIQAQFTPDPLQLKRFIQNERVDYFLVPDDGFTLEFLTLDPWLAQFQPETAIAGKSLEEGEIPALRKFADKATVFRSGRFQVIDARKILDENETVP